MQSGISHSLPFPLKTDIMHQLPALNVLLVACETTPDVTFDAALPVAETTDHELPLTWPANLPFSITFDLANHPILDTIRSVLFPNAHPGTYLFAVKDKLEIFLAGSHSEPRRPVSPRSVDGAKLVATIIVTLPVRFRGGSLVVRNLKGLEEQYPATQPQGPSGETLLHWTAFTADCEHEVEFVEQGSRMCISYGVYNKTFGPAGLRPDPLLTPSDQLLDTLSPLLNLTRGRTLGIYLTGWYNCSPTDILADSLVPSVSDLDALLARIAFDMVHSSKAVMRPCTTHCGCSSLRPSSVGLRKAISGPSTRPCRSAPTSSERTPDPARILITPIVHPTRLPRVAEARVNGAEVSRARLLPTTQARGPWE